MAGIKISEATLREQLKGTENLPIVDTDLDAGRTTIDNIKDYVQQDISSKQDILTAGQGITIEDNVISVNVDLSKIEESLDNKTDEMIEGTNGKSYIWNETSGGGARFVNNDGTTSFVGVNEGGADGIGVQIYDKDNSTNVGTRINVYTKGAYYIPNMSNSDANYTADDPNREIAVKGDIENLATAESLNELSEKVDSLSSAVAPTKVSDLENDLEFITLSELSEVKTTLEERIAILIDRVTALEEQSNVQYNN